MVISLNRRLVVKMIFFLYWIYFVLSYIGGTWVYSNSKYGMMPIYTSTVNYIRMAYLILLLLFGLYELLRQIKLGWLSQIDKLLIIIFFVISIYKFIEVSTLTDAQTLLFESGTPMMYLVFIVFFIGMDDYIEETLRKSAKFFGTLFLIMTILYFLLFCIDVGYSLGDRFSSGPILYSFNNGFFFIVYALYQESDFENKRLWKWILPILLLAAFITSSRSWVVQSIFVVMMYFILQNRGRHVIGNILKSICVIIAILLIVRSISPNIINGLLARIGESTRSSQLEAFFDQISISNLISGMGFNASYRFLTWDNYQFIDNQVIFSCFRYGIVVTGLLLYFLLKPMFYNVSIGKEKFFHSIGIIHFVLAMLGVSIYFSLSIDAWCIIAYILSGRTYLNARKEKYAKIEP